jgi:hypothetical protein
MFAKAVANLWNYTYGMGDHPETIKGIRHPDLVDEKRKMSRDHYVYTLALLKEAMRDGIKGNVSDKFHMIINSSPREVEHMMRFNLSLVCWAKALKGNKFAEWWFYALQIFTAAFLYLPLTGLGNLIAGFTTKEVDQDDWAEYSPKYLQEQRRYKRWIDKIIYPAFARGFLMTQVYALDDNFPVMREALLKAHRPLVGSTNYVHKLQLGMKVPEDKVKWYQSMRGGRWSGWLNNRNDRYIQKLSGYKDENLFSVDWLRYWWNRKA